MRCWDAEVKARVCGHNRPLRAVLVARSRPMVPPHSAMPCGASSSRARCMAPAPSAIDVLNSAQWARWPRKLHRARKRACRTPRVIQQHRRSDESGQRRGARPLGQRKSRGLLLSRSCCVSQSYYLGLVTRLTLRTGDNIRTGARRSKTKNEDWNRPLAIPAATFLERLTVSCKPWAMPENRQSSMPPRCIPSDLVALLMCRIAEGDACSAGPNWESQVARMRADMILNCLRSVDDCKRRCAVVESGCWVVGASRRVFHHKVCCVVCAVVCAARLLSERVCWVVRV